MPVTSSTVFLFVCMFETSSAALWLSTLSHKLKRIHWRDVHCFYKGSTAGQTGCDGLFCWLGSGSVFTGWQLNSDTCFTAHLNELWFYFHTQNCSKACKNDTDTLTMLTVSRGQYPVLEKGCPPCEETACACTGILLWPFGHNPVAGTCSEHLPVALSTCSEHNPVVLSTCNHHNPVAVSTSLLL